MDHNPPSPNPIPQRISSVSQRTAPNKSPKRSRRPLSDDYRHLNGGGTSHFDHDLSKYSSAGLIRSAANRVSKHGGRERKSKNGIGEDFIYNNSKRWSEEKERILLGPYDYLDSHPGKDIRSQLISAFNVWLQVPKESLEVITKVVGMLHTASLLIDDVEDSSLLRRGVPVAHSIFGTAQTINSANYVYFRALRELSRLNSPRAMDVFTSELLNLHRGQGMDLFWRDTLTCPSEEDYLEMVDNKTGGLFRLAVKLMQAESSRDIPAVLPLCNTVGLLFQILDDYRNLCNPTYTTNKGLAEDLTEGKFSFPVIHAIRADDPAKAIVLNVLRQKTSDPQVKRYAVRYMDTVTRSFAYTRGVLRELNARAESLVGEVEREDGVGGEGRGDAVRRILESMRVEEEDGESVAGNGDAVNAVDAAGGGGAGKGLVESAM